MAPASTDTSARSYTLSFLISTLRKLLQQKCHFLKENALDGGLRSFFTGKREVKENKKNNKNKEKEGQARERCYGSCFWFVLFCDFLKTVKNIEK